MKYPIVINTFPFNMIKNRKQRVDIRLFTKKIQSIKIGDVIEYENDMTGEKMLCTVKGMAFFENFKDLVENITPQLIGYDSEEEVMVRIKRAFTKEELDNFNVIGIFLDYVGSGMIEKIKGARGLSL